MGMITGETKSGFKFSVDADAVKDMEFLDLVGEASTNPAKLGKMYECLLGKEQKKALELVCLIRRLLRKLIVF